MEIEKMAPIIWVIALVQPINGFVNVGGGILQGAQDFFFQVKTVVAAAGVVVVIVILVKGISG